MPIVFCYTGKFIFCGSVITSRMWRADKREQGRMEKESSFTAGVFLQISIGRTLKKPMFSSCLYGLLFKSFHSRLSLVLFHFRSQLYILALLQCKCKAVEQVLWARAFNLVIATSWPALTWLSFLRLYEDFPAQLFWRTEENVRE